MKWAAVIEYIRDAEKINAVRPQHRAYLTSLVEADKLVCSGPFTDDYGALIVYEADTREAAEELIRNDPFHANGVFVRWDVRPWKMVFANPRLLTVLKLFSSMLIFNPDCRRHMRRLARDVRRGTYVPKLEKQESDLYMNPRRVR